MFNLLEDPTLILVVGAILELFLLITLWQTGRGAVLWAMAAVALVVAVGCAIEWLVVTDREGVESALYSTASALERNDVQGVLDLVADDAGPMREQLALLLPSLTIERAKIRDLEIDVQAKTDPKTARARLRGIIHLRDAPGQMPYETYMRRFAVRLREEGGRWVLTDYEELPNDGPGLPGFGER